MTLYEGDETEAEFKLHLFLLRFLILNDRSKIPLSFLSSAYGITTDIDSLESRFTNSRLILLTQKALSQSKLDFVPLSSKDKINELF